jgi:hypothetical protein
MRHVLLAVIRVASSICLSFLAACATSPETKDPFDGLKSLIEGEVDETSEPARLFIRCARFIDFEETGTPRTGRSDDEIEVPGASSRGRVNLRTYTLARAGAAKLRVTALPGPSSQHQSSLNAFVLTTQFHAS